MRHIVILSFLYYPCQSTDLVEFLLSKGAQPDLQDKKGRTPIMLAVELGNLPIVNLLAQNQANLKLLDAEGKGRLVTSVKY